VVHGNPVDQINRTVFRLMACYAFLHFISMGKPWLHVQSSLVSWQVMVVFVLNRTETHIWCLIAVCTLLKVQNITLDRHVNVKGVRS